MPVAPNSSRYRSRKRRIAASSSKTSLTGRRFASCCGAGRTLGQRVEAADALDRVAEKIEPQRLRRPRRVEVDDAAAHREFARLAHRVGADVAVVAEEALQSVEADPS